MRATLSCRTHTRTPFHHIHAGRSHCFRTGNHASDRTGSLGHVAIWKGLWAPMDVGLRVLYRLLSARQCLNCLDNFFD
jgi:hypothetical protein